MTCRSPVVVEIHTAMQMIGMVVMVGAVSRPVILPALVVMMYCTADDPPSPTVVTACTMRVILPVADGGDLHGGGDLHAEIQHHP